MVKLANLRKERLELREKEIEKGIVGIEGRHRRSREEKEALGQLKKLMESVKKDLDRAAGEEALLTV
jgi:hypothetical protein